MSDVTTPKEQLTAYERWELPNFDMAQPGVRHFTPSTLPAGRKGLPTAAQLDQLHQQAHDEGYQAGYAAGIQAAAQETQRLAGLVQSLQQSLQQVDQQIAQELLTIALEVSRQMLQQTLQVKPELIIDVINAAIANLPQFNQGAHLVMHPDDAALVREMMGEQLSHSGWKIFENATIARGGLRVETAHSQIDATLATRWQHITAALGVDHSWLQE